MIGITQNARAEQRPRRHGRLRRHGSNNSIRHSPVGRYGAPAGRALIDVSAEPASGGGTPDHRTVAEQWIKGILVELDASTTDGSPLDTTLDFEALRRLATTLNQHPDTFGITPEPPTTESSEDITTTPRESTADTPPETVPADSSPVESVQPGG